MLHATITLVHQHDFMHLWILRHSLLAISHVGNHAILPVLNRTAAGLIGLLEEFVGNKIRSNALFRYPPKLALVWLSCTITPCSLKYTITWWKANYYMMYYYLCQSDSRYLDWVIWGVDCAQIRAIRTHRGLVGHDSNRLEFWLVGMFRLRFLSAE